MWSLNKLSQLKLRDVLLLFSIVLFAIVIANRLLYLGSLATLGSIFRNIIPAIPFLFLIVIIYTTDFSSFRISSIFSWTHFKPDIRYPSIVWILILVTSILFGLSIYKYSSALGGMMSFFLFLFIFSLFFTSIYVSSRYGAIYGLSLFFVAAPIMLLLQRLFTFNLLPDLKFNFTPMLIFTLTLFFINVLNNFYQKNKIIPASPLNKPVGIFLLVIIITTAISSDNLIQSYNSIALEIIIPLIFFFMTINSVNSKKDIERTLLFILIAIIGTCFISFYLYAWFNPVDMSLARWEIAQKTGDAQRTYVLLTIIGLPISLALIEVFKTKLKRIIAILGTIFLALFTVILQTISTFYSTIIGSSLVIIKSRYRKTYIYLTILLLTFIILFPGPKDVLFLRFRNLDLSDYGNVVDHFLKTRLIGWEGAINHIKDYPFFGAGYGMYYTRKHLYSKATTGYYRDKYGFRRFRVDYSQAHSLYLEHAADCGLIGLSALLFLIGSILAVSIKVVRASKSGNDKIISVSLLGSILGFFIMSITSPTNFGSGSNFIWGAILWTLIGLVCVMRRHQIEEKEK